MADTVDASADVDPETLRRVTFVAEKGKSGLWFLTSPEIPGLFVTGLTLQDAVSVLPNALDGPAGARSPAGTDAGAPAS